MANKRVLSCIPEQLSDTDEKIKWYRKQIKKHQPDIFVFPQEFFGGIVMMPHKKEFHKKELLHILQKDAAKNNCAMAVGVVEKDDDGPFNKEVIWYIDESGEYLGQVQKMALPRYDHISTKGGGNIEPETQWENRFKTFTLHGMECTSIFCWEAFSDLLWSGIALCKPDLVFSQIKFGANSWPKVKPNKDKIKMVEGFGYGSWPKEPYEWHEVWMERLFFASRWQVKCPVINSTNSWNLRPISMPLAGTICTLDGQAEHSLWYPTKEMGLKQIPEKIIVDEIDRDRIRASTINKFIYKDMVGEFPPFSLAKYTMMLKINRLQDRIIEGKEQKNIEKLTKRITGGFQLV